MDKFTFVSNNCQGENIYKTLGKEYETPFIGSYFEDDEQFVKFCLNYEYYTDLERVTPKFIEYGENKLPFDTTNSGYTKNFPIMMLDDIEIHWIHETSDNGGREILLEKYKRRLERSKNKIPFFIWGDFLIHRSHPDKVKFELIEKFKTLPNSFFIWKDDIPEYNHLSINDRNINPGWGQPVRWINFDITSRRLLQLINFDK